LKGCYLLIRKVLESQESNHSQIGE
jgi:hypothetical protein